MTPITGRTAYNTLNSAVEITFLTEVLVRLSFPVEDVFSKVVGPVTPIAVDSIFTVSETVVEDSSPGVVLPDLNIVVDVVEKSVCVEPGGSVPDVDVTVLDFAFDVKSDVTDDVSVFVVNGEENEFVTVDTAVDVVGVSVEEGCVGTIVTPGLKHCTLIGEFSNLKEKWKQNPPDQFSDILAKEITILEPWMRIYSLSPK